MLSPDYFNQIIKVSTESLQLTRNLDRIIESDPPFSYHCVQVFPGFVPTLKHDSIITRKLGYDVYTTYYDYYIVLLSEIGSVRAIRFSGRVQRLNVNESFRVERLERKKDDRSKIGEELTGTFITYGNIENVKLVELQIYISLLMGFIRPLVLDEGHRTAIIPSPLSLIAYEEHNSHKSSLVYLSPASVIVQLDEKVQKTRIELFNKYVNGIMTNGFMFSFDGSFFYRIGPFRILIPLTYNETKDMYQAKAVKNFKGIFFFKRSPPYMIPGSEPNAYFLALEEAPFNFDSKILGILGKVLEFKIKTPIHSPKKSDVKMEIMKEKIIYPFISINSKALQEARSKFHSFERKLTGSNAVEPINKPTISDHVEHDKFFYKEPTSNELFYLTPPFISKLVHENIPLDAKNLLVKVKETVELQLQDLWEITNPFSEKSGIHELKVILEAGLYSNKWRKLYSEYIDFAKKHKLKFLL
ncbi:hypothetical protein MA03_03725 [Infirmifilum uzonense]|uniref:Uncharacterized protein n=1 Tax=Infirmifilum uzonense TaxID=1550241 RepID=A0A0F7FHE4_9CREN|nr:hypothetical protein [Infirmifilum uzonense]AKG38573.1 hypothetical protein MA03_03725 [Infirmifilum uzonense]